MNKELKKNLILIVILLALPKWMKKPYIELMDMCKVVDYKKSNWLPAVYHTASPDEIDTTIYEQLVGMLAVQS